MFVIYTILDFFKSVDYTKYWRDLNVSDFYANELVEYFGLVFLMKEGDPFNLKSARNNGKSMEIGITQGSYSTSELIRW